MLYFAGWKQHYSLYPVTERVVAAYQVHKGTIRLIGRIAKLHAKEVAPH